MRTFEDIPNEILLEIVGDVQSLDQLSLSLTSQRLLVKDPTGPTE